MRVTLVTLTDLLPNIFSSLNPLNYGVIVVDDVEKAKKIISEVGLSENIVHPFYELGECLQNFYCDFVLCVTDMGMSWIIHKQFMKYKFPKNKYVNICISHSINSPFFVERTLRYYTEHSEEFEMFATGISWTAVGLDVNQFKRKLFNFGRSSQDLYSDFKIAEYIMKSGGGGKIRYALIGLTPYSFHYDNSEAYALSWRLLPFFIVFDDLHNFWMPKEQYRNLFKPEFLSIRYSTENFDVNNPYFEKTPLRFMTPDSRINARERIDMWRNRYFPKTRDENIKILDEYLTLCEKNSVRPIMFLPPTTEGSKKYFNKKLADEFFYLVGEALNKHTSAIFLNGWNLGGFSDEDFYDVEHLNLQGAAKFSSIFNQVIEDLEK